MTYVTSGYRKLSQCAAEHACLALSDLASGQAKPSEAGDPVCREMVFRLAPSDMGDVFEKHIKPSVYALGVDFQRRGAPHSFVTPPWSRPFRHFVCDYTASDPNTGAVARATLAMDGDMLEVSIAWMARFAALTSEPAQSAPAAR